MFLDEVMLFENFVFFVFETLVNLDRQSTYIFRVRTLQELELVGLFSFFHPGVE
jgi:hypothetical protein